MAEFRNTRKPMFLRLRPGERRIILFLGDLIASMLGLLVSIFLWAQRDWLDFTRLFWEARVPAWFYFLPIIWIALIVELYDIRRASRRNDTIRGILVAALVSFLLYLFVFFLSKENSLPRVAVALFIVMSAVLTLLWRLIYISAFTTQSMMRRVLVVGAGRAGTALAVAVKAITPPPFQIVGYVDDDISKHRTMIESFPVLCASCDLDQVVDRERITDIILAISGEVNPDLFQSLMRAEENGIELTTMVKVYEELLGRVPIFLLQSDWVLRSFVDQSHTSGFFEGIKRLIDIVGALVGIVGVIVTYPFIALAILIDTGTPIFFLQNRLGKNGRPYMIIKYRTMVKDAEKDGKPRTTTANDERVTRAGRFLRKSHFDELPQFINVLRGEMSLVGPRAERSELVENLQMRIPFYRARLLVKPGITGWAQINFGYAATVEDTAVKLEYDLYYISHRTILQDVMILLRTFGQVIGFRGQ